MAEVIQIWDWKRQRDLDSTLGQLLRQYHDVLLKRLAVPRETICVCYLRDRDGAAACVSCPENNEPNGAA